MYDMCTSDLSFWTMVSWSLPGPSCMTCVHQIFPSELWFLGLYLVLHVWHVYIRSFLLNYGFLVSTWSFMYDMCTSDLSFWTMVSWSLPGPSCMTCVHQIFPSELWFLGLYLVLHVWHVYIRSFLLNYGFLVSTWFFMYDMCTSDLSFWTMVSWSTWSFMNDMCTSDLSFWTMVSWSTWFFMYMTCVHQIFPSELWFLGIYLVLHVWHVYIRSFLLNYGFLVSTWSFMYDMCTSDLSFWTMVSWSLPGPSCMTCVHQIFPSEWYFLGLPSSFMYDMCTSDLSFWTMVSWSLRGSSCMTCVHQIFPSELWFLGLYLVLHVWHVYIRSFLLNYGFLVSTCCLSCMTCVHQIFPSELWFLGLYLVLHVWHVYIRSFLLNYGFLVSTWSFMYDMCTSDLSFWTMVSWSLPGPSCMTCVHQIFPSELWFLGLYLVLHVWHVYIRSFLLNYGFLFYLVFHVYDMCTSDLSFWTMVSWSLPGSSCMTCVHQIFPSELWFLGLYLVLHVWHVYIRSIPSELWFLGLYLVLHVWHVYIRSFLLNYGFLVSTWSFMYDMCTSDLSFWTMVSWSIWFFMYNLCTSHLSLFLGL